MKIQRSKASDSRRILTGMIVDKHALSAIAAIWDRKNPPFASRWENLIGGWCVRYYKKYHKAPRSQIEGLFDEWAETQSDAELVKLIEKFLQSLSDQYTQLAADSNTDYILDLAAKCFTKAKINKLKDEMEGLIEVGQVDKAIEKIHKFSQVDIGMGAGVVAFEDVAAIGSAHGQANEPVIVWPDALGFMFQDSFAKDSLVAFWGKEKVGKTHWLLHTAFTALEQGNKVAFFSVGDMSQNQMMMRIAIRASGHPKDAGTIKIPTFLEPGDPPEPEFHIKKFTEKIPLDVAKKAMADAGRKYGADSLKLSCHPNGTMTVAGIKSILESWERQGWVPSVVVIDYADIIASPPGFSESRDGINETWKQLRALSQSHHCCVVTATQTDAGSYDEETITRKNFSEDKRKLAHATAIFGINQQDKEKEAQLMRINCVAIREFEYIETKCCYVAGCLAIGNPAILSCY